MQPPTSATRTEQSKVARFSCRPLSRSSSQLHGVWRTGLDTVDRALRREGRPLHQVSSSSPGPRVQVGPTSGQSHGHRSAALGPLRSTKTILGRTTWARGPERRDPSQPRRDVWGTLYRMASPISLTLSHLAPTRGLVRNGGAVPAFQVGMSEGVKV
jgi:hypothetical protein